MKVNEDFHDTPVPQEDQNGCEWTVQMENDEEESVGRTQIDREGSTIVEANEELPGEGYSKNFVMIYHCLKDLGRVVNTPERSKLIQAVRSCLISIEESYTGENVTKNQMPPACSRRILGNKRKTKKNCEPRLKKEEEEQGRTSDDEGNEPHHLFALARKKKLQMAVEQTITVYLSLDGRHLVCAVCDAKVDLVDKNCYHCNCVFLKTMAVNSKGFPLPECTHEGFSESMTCKSCRFWKYVSIMEEETEKHYRAVEEKKTEYGADLDCPVCGRKNKESTMKGWRCQDCYLYEVRLVQRHKDGKPLPSCSHKGEKIDESCRGCRRYNIQTKWSIFTPEEPVDLPEYPEIPSNETDLESGEENDEPLAKKVKLEVCPVCNQMSSVMMNWRCKSCYLFEFRLYLKHAQGKELPICYHKGKRLYLGCFGCRHFHFQIQWKIHNPDKVLSLPPYPENPFKETEYIHGLPNESEFICCAICGKRSYFFKLWCCMGCYLLKNQLVQAYREGEDLPECNHRGEKGIECKGCFLFILNSTWSNHTPDEPLNLPPCLVQSPTDELKMCSVCGTDTEARSMIDWRCMFCHRFEMRLYYLHREGLPLPVCDHQGAHQKEKCEGCLRYHFQVSWKIFLPDKSLLLPEYKHPSKRGSSGSGRGGTIAKRNKTEEVSAESDSVIIETYSDEAEMNEHCPVCLSQKPLTKMMVWRCSGCYYFGLRLKNTLAKQLKLPSCEHDPKGSQKCTGCRRFNLQKLWRKNSPSDYPNFPPMEFLPKPSQKDLNSTCSVCEEESDTLKLWRCEKCFLYEQTLVQMYQVGLNLPACQHQGSRFLDGCDGCRRYRIQVQWEANDPNGSDKLPPYVEKEIIKKCQSDSDDDGVSKRCPVCSKVTPALYQWRCSSCAEFEMALESRHQEGRRLPSCHHKGENFENGCQGCHRYLLQRRRRIYAPHDYLDIPPLPEGPGEEQIEAELPKVPGKPSRVKRPSAKALAIIRSSFHDASSPEDDDSGVKKTCCICEESRLIASFTLGDPQGPVCATCLNFRKRLHSLVRSGGELSLCQHRGEMIKERCGGCRRFYLEKNWNKYSTQPLDIPLVYTDMLVGSPNRETKEGKLCVVCRKVKTSNSMKDWRCKPCYYFETRLLARVKERRELPSCSHNGDKVNDCAGCRRYNLQEQWKIHQPNVPFRLPIIDNDGKTSDDKDGGQENVAEEESEESSADDCVGEELVFQKEKKCQVCQENVKYLRQWRCESCYKFEIRLVQRFQEGRALPSCQHKGKKLKQPCKGCRRYIAELQRKKHDGNIPWLRGDQEKASSEDEEDNGGPVCPVCDKQKEALVEWRCNDCFKFEKKLDLARRNGSRLPICSHLDGKNRDKGCRGCLRFLLEKKMEVFAPDDALQKTKGTEGKTSTTCPVCCKETNSLRVWRCVSCVHFEVRLFKKYQSKQPLPSCDHEGEKVAEGCAGCRRYNLMIQRELYGIDSYKYLPPMCDTKSQEGHCPVCQLDRRLKDWKCAPCILFERRLVAKYDQGFELPECDHSEAVEAKCSGCRRNRLEEHWLKNQPDEPYPLPTMMEKYGKTGKPQRKSEDSGDSQRNDSFESQTEIMQEAEYSVNESSSVGLSSGLEKESDEVTPDKLGSILPSDDNKKSSKRPPTGGRKNFNRKEQNSTRKTQRASRKTVASSRKCLAGSKSQSSPNQLSNASEQRNESGSISPGDSSSIDMLIKDEQFDSNFEIYDEEPSFLVIAGTTSIAPNVIEPNHAEDGANHPSEELNDDHSTPDCQVIDQVGLDDEPIMVGKDEVPKEVDLDEDIIDIDSDEDPIEVDVDGGQMEWEPCFTTAY